jgi:predicted nucleic acid-binding protein
MTITLDIAPEVEAALARPVEAYAASLLEEAAQLPAAPRHRVVKGYLVDTKIPSELTPETPDARVSAFLKNAGKESVFLSVMTIGEIGKGIDLLPVGKKRSGLQSWLEIDVHSWFAGRILPVTESIAERWGHLAAATKQRGIAMTVVNGVIAATALGHGLTLVTRNVRDFASLGVVLLNPWDAV